ncbi:unnamed protein product [Thlaspi arvense]|uniref:Uncharacterized protein n=1 Tax=Thlaspi arvense TaxID=13288 RepID=A0AAU9S084_THLAR|nr:unnamed protein product [Thlaspi arvense]
MCDYKSDQVSAKTHTHVSPHNQSPISSAQILFSVKETSRLMSCMLGCSNGTVAIATAMVFSSTALFLAMARQFHGNQTSKVQDQTPVTPGPILRSCLSSEETKKQRKKKNKKVRFAENVKDTKGNGKEYRMRELSWRTVPEPVTNPGKTGSNCGISTIPANRMALYNGILRDRDHRTQCSY